MSKSVSETIWWKIGEMESAIERETLNESDQEIVEPIRAEVDDYINIILRPLFFEISDEDNFTGLRGSLDDKTP